MPIKSKKNNLISFFITVLYRNHLHTNGLIQKMELSADLRACVSFSGDLLCYGNAAARVVVVFF